MDQSTRSWWGIQDLSMASVLAETTNTSFLVLVIRQQDYGAHKPFPIWLSTKVITAQCGMLILDLMDSILQLLHMIEQLVSGAAIISTLCVSSLAIYRMSM